MDNDTQSELYFLIAKFLRSKFPEVGDAFIKECENKKLFPSCVFSTNPSFEELDSHSLSGIPNDQLMRLVSMALPKSQYPSLFYTPPQTNQKVSVSDLLSKQIGPPLPFFIGMNPIKRVIGHFKPIFCLAVDLTSQILITGADDSLIKIWKIPSMSLISTIHSHTGFISEIIIHPSNRFFVSSSLDGTFSFFSLLTNQIIFTQRCTGAVNGLRFSPDGNFLAVATEDGHIELLKINVDTCSVSAFVMRILVPNGRCANWASFSPGSKFLSFVTGNNSVVVVCPSTERYERLDGHTEMVDQVTFSQQTCRRLMSHSPKDRSIRIWEEKGGIFQEAMDLSPRNPQNSRAKAIRACWNCDETKLVTISSSQIFVWSSKDETPKFETCTYGTEKCTVLAMHPTLPNIAFVACDNGHASIWDINTLDAVCKMQVSDSPHISEAMWSNDGQYIFAADNAGGITIFGKPSGPFTTTQEMFYNDNNKNVFGFVETNKDIVNASGIPLNPQPKHYYLPEIQLAVKPKEIDPAVIADEEELILFWNAIDVRKLEPERLPNIARTFFYHEIEDPGDAMTRRMMEELEREPDFTPRDNFVPDPEEDGDFVEAQHEAEEDDGEEESSSENAVDEIALPKTRSAGPVPEDEPMQLRPRKTADPEEVNSDMLDEFDQRHEVSAQFSSDEEIKPKPKPKPRPPRTRRSRSRSRIDEDDMLLNSDDYIDRIPSEEELSDEAYEKAIPEERKLPIYDDTPLPVVDTPIPIWMYNDKRYQHTFVPQFGEKVVYIKSGHQKASDVCNTKLYTPPYTRIKQMPEITIGYVNTIECTPDYLLTYITFELKRGYKSGVVAFPINESQPFLVPHSLYTRSLENVKTLKIDDVVDIAFNEDNKITYYKAHVKEINPDFERRPYECITVELCESSDVYKLCPWEIMLPDPEQTPIGKMSQAMLAPVQALAAMEQYAPFVSARAEWQKDAVWKHLSFPMDLELFIARLENGWYQTLNEMKVEVLLFAQNSQFLGQPAAEAAELTDKITSMIELKAKYAQVDDIEIPQE